MTIWWGVISSRGSWWVWEGAGRWWINVLFGSFRIRTWEEVDGGELILLLIVKLGWGLRSELLEFKFEFWDIIRFCNFWRLRGVGKILSCEEKLLLKIMNIFVNIKYMLISIVKFSNLSKILASLRPVFSKPLMTSILPALQPFFSPQKYHLSPKLFSSTYSRLPPSFKLKTLKYSFTTLKQ